MNTRRILTVLKSEGFDAASRFTSAGTEVGVRVPMTDRWAVGLVPIDDESDMRFVDFLEGEVRKAQAK